MEHSDFEPMMLFECSLFEHFNGDLSGDEPAGYYYAEDDDDALFDIFENDPTRWTRSNTPVLMSAPTDDQTSLDDKEITVRNLVADVPAHAQQLASHRYLS